LNGAWHRNVLLEADALGRWSRITPNCPAPDDVPRLGGPVLPPLVNAHSHAFQRAFVGLAERREDAEDSFWSWRDRMYRVAAQVDPSILVTAARTAGIGLTLVPVLYERGGFDGRDLSAAQQRFRCTPDILKALRQAVDALRTGSDDDLLRTGVGVHSLRAATPASIATLAQIAAASDGPVHVHVAEQLAEVEDSLKHTGRRPVEWLLSEGLLTPAWQLVHATHLIGAEVAGIAATGAGIVLCPTTEANLGDGLPPLAEALAAGIPLTVGSDSQVTRDWREELRWLDYTQRLQRRVRNASAAPEDGQPSTAARLYDRMQAGSAAAAGLRLWGLQPGGRADLLVVDSDAASLAGLPLLQLLDALVFSSPAVPWRDVMVAGRWRSRREPAGSDAADWRQAMQRLWLSEEESTSRR